MAGIIDCILKKVDVGLVDKEFAKNVEKRLNGLSARDMLDEARSMADEFNFELDAEIKQAITFTEVQRDLRRLVTKTADKDELVNNLDHYFNDHIDNLRDFYADQYMAPWAVTLEGIRPDMFGRMAKKEMQRNILKAFYNEPGQSALSQKAANGIRKSLKLINRDSDALGFKTIAEDHIPSVFLSNRVYRAGNFVDDVMKHGDLDALRQVAGADIKAYSNIAEYLEEIENFLVHGTHARPVHGADVAPYKLLRNFEEGFKAKSADAWQYIDDVYGAGSLYSALNDVAERNAKNAARSVALVNRESGLKLAREMTDAARKKTGAFTNVPKALEDSVKFHFGDFTVDRPRGRAVTAVFGAVRGLKNVMAAAKLGTTPVQAVISDSTFRQVAVMQKGLYRKGHYVAYHDTFKQLAKGADGRRMMAKMGLQLDFFREYAETAARRANAITGTAWTEAYASSAMKISGLSGVTTASRRASANIMNSFLTDHIRLAKNWDELLPETRGFFKKSGLTRELFEVLQENIDQFAVKADAGAELLDLGRMFASDNVKLQRAARAIGATSKDLAALATPTNSVKFQKVRAKMMSTHPLLVPITESATTFMSFSFSVMNRWVVPNWNRAGYKWLAGLTAGLTTSTVLYGQVKDVIQGKQPRSAADPKTWSDAFIEASLLPYASYLFSDYGSSIALAGAPMQPFKQAFDITRRFSKDLANDKETQLTYDISALLLSLTPGQSLWYGRLVFERAIKDQLQLLADPDGYTKQARKISRQQKKGGYWWNPGELTPN